MSKQEQTEAAAQTETNDHGVEVGVELSFGDVLKMQRKIWAAGQADSDAETEVVRAEKPTRKPRGTGGKQQ